MDTARHTREVHPPSGIKRRWLLNSLSLVAGILAIVIIVFSLWSVAYYLFISHNQSDQTGSDDGKIHESLLKSQL